MDKINRNSGRWLWLSGLTAIAVIAHSIGKPLVAAGMLFLGVFAFFNDPLVPTPSKLTSPTAIKAVSWACGLAGISLIIAAAIKAWL